MPVAAVALRWLADQPTVVAPIASGRSVEQLADLLPMLDLVLTDEQRSRSPTPAPEAVRRRHADGSAPLGSQTLTMARGRRHQLRGHVGDAVVGGGVAGDLAEDAVLVGGA